MKDCGTSRPSKGIGIFQIKSERVDHLGYGMVDGVMERRSSWSKETKAKELDSNLKLISINSNTCICERHFRNEDIETYRSGCFFPLPLVTKISKSE